MDTNYPLISVVVPVYKVEPYLRKCVDSLLKQTYPNLEVILVDDGSPDNCPLLCDQLAAEHEIVVAYHKANGGLGSARNYGVERAKSEWIVFVDSDDYVLPEYIGYMWNLQQKYNADLVTCEITMVDESGNEISKNSLVDPKVLTGAETISFVYFEGKNGYQSYSKLIKKEHLLKYPFPEGYFEDFATSYLYFHESKKVAIGDGSANYRYVQREGSILNSKLNSKHLHAFELCDEISDFITGQYPEYKKYIPRLYQGQVIQILNKQFMEKKEFSKIFNRYKRMFRRKGLKLVKDSKISRNVKFYMILLCTTPGIYKFIRNRAKRYFGN